MSADDFFYTFFIAISDFFTIFAKYLRTLLQIMSNFMFSI